MVLKNMINLCFRNTFSRVIGPGNWYYLCFFILVGLEQFTYKNTSINTISKKCPTNNILFLVCLRWCLLRHGIYQKGYCKGVQSRKIYLGTKVNFSKRSMFFCVGILIIFQDSHFYSYKLTHYTYLFNPISKRIEIKLESRSTWVGKYIFL